MAPPYFQVVALCFLGGVLGLAAMIPLRRLLIVQAADELPVPEGTACAEVLRATVADSSGSVWIFRGMAVGAAVKILVSLAFLLPVDDPRDAAVDPAEAPNWPWSSRRRCSALATSSATASRRSAWPARWCRRSR